MNIQTMWYPLQALIGANTPVIFPDESRSNFKWFGQFHITTAPEVLDYSLSTTWLPISCDTLEFGCLRCLCCAGRQARRRREVGGTNGSSIRFGGAAEQLAATGRKMCVDSSPMSQLSIDLMAVLFPTDRWYGLQYGTIGPTSYLQKHHGTQQFSPFNRSSAGERLCQWTPLCWDPMQSLLSPLSHRQWCYMFDATYQPHTHTYTQSFFCTIESHIPVFLADIEAGDDSAVYRSWGWATHM